MCAQMMAAVVEREEVEDETSGETFLFQFVNVTK